jgi:hypothetical protein
MIVGAFGSEVWPAPENVQGRATNGQTVVSPFRSRGVEDYVIK